MERRAITKRVQQLRAEFDALTSGLERERERLRIAGRMVKHAGKAQIVAQMIAQEVQRRVHQNVAQVVSRCLEVVFDEPYQFQILFEQKRGRTEARMVFLRDGQEVDPMEASGGGVVDVAAFAVRLSRLHLAQPSLRRVIVLDEPFKYVSEGYRENVRLLLQTLAKEMGFQIIMVTHIRELQCGTVVKIR